MTEFIKCRLILKWSSIIKLNGISSTKLRSNKRKIEEIRRNVSFFIFSITIVYIQELRSLFVVYVIWPLGPFKIYYDRETFLLLLQQLL
jgi:hypothetical protein